MATNRRTPNPWLRRSRRRRQQRSKAMPAWLKIAIGLGALGSLGFVVLAIASIVVYSSYAERPGGAGRAGDQRAIVRREDPRPQRQATLRVRRRPRRAAAPGEAGEHLAGFPRGNDRDRGQQLLHQPRHQHQGAGPRRLGEQPAAARSVFEGSGGSSITQQLVKNVYIPVEDRQERFSSEGLDRKIKETVYAMELTQRYSKDAVLGVVRQPDSYGGVYNGVEAAARATSARRRRT